MATCAVPTAIFFCYSSPQLCRRVGCVYVFGQRPVGESGRWGRGEDVEMFSGRDGTGTSLGWVLTRFMTQKIKLCLGYGTDTDPVYIYKLLAIPIPHSQEGGAPTTASAAAHAHAPTHPPHPSGART
ncbi:hypothetical protein CRG98_026858 [Punica granatum]|uniref:Uncharacterized protein n=1 Tax=Punica granatum TaxID=22663 RepID=A0A2I0J923_PUNGR|nr:hypothetical protein CRG98_026858 [Punica granatum]